MIAMAYVNSTEAPFGMGRRSVINISPQVTTLIPGYTYLDIQIIAAVSLGDKVYKAKDLLNPTRQKIQEIMEDAGFDFDKILKTCGKQQAIQQDGGEDGDAVDNDEDGDDGDDGDEDNRTVATNATGRTAASASSSGSTTSTEASGKPLSGMEELLLTYKMCKSLRCDGVTIV
jgi:hypothetical protein